MGSPPKLTTYRFRAILGNPEDPDSLVELEVLGVGRDVQQAERLFADRKWGETASRPATAAAAVSYFALQRSGKFTGSFDEFEAQYLSIEPVEAVVATPTAAAAAAA